MISQEHFVVPYGRSQMTAFIDLSGILLIKSKQSPCNNLYIYSPLKTTILNINMRKITHQPCNEKYPLTSA